MKDVAEHYLAFLQSMSPFFFVLQFWLAALTAICSDGTCSLVSRSGSSLRAQETGKGNSDQQPRRRCHRYISFEEVLLLLQLLGSLRDT